MSAYHLYQPVRIVRSDNPLLNHLVGVETYVTGFKHPDEECPILLAVRGIFGGQVSADPEHIEPIRYLPDAADLATQAGSPDFEILAPMVEVRAA